MCLVDDPRTEHAKGKKIGIEHLGNVAGGDATEYLNVPNQFMKDCVKQILVEQGIPVWFGADCHPFMDRENGAWATDLFEYGRVYDVDFDLDKEARVRFGDSAMNHAMLRRPLTWPTTAPPAAGAWRTLGAPRSPTRATSPCPTTGSPNTSTR